MSKTAILKNIIIISDFSYPNGGAALVALRSAKGLAESGYNVSLLSAEKNCVDWLEPHLFHHSTTNQLSIVDLSCIAGAVQGLWNSKAVTEFNKLLANFDPQETIIHIHEWSKALSPSIIWAALRSKFPMTITFHDYFICCPNSGLFNFPAKKVCHIRPDSISCFFTNCDSRSRTIKIWRYFRHILQSVIIRYCHLPPHCITVSDFSKSILKQHTNQRTNIHVIPNPIEARRGQPANPSQNKSFVQIGRLSPEKGAHLFAEACKKANVQGALVGTGEMKSKLEEINPSLIFHGWCTSNDVMKILDKSRVVVFPSVWYETQGMAVLEAKSRGIPVIVSDAGASKCMVTDNFDGLWFKSGDAEDLALKIAKLRDDDEFVRRLGKNAYENFWKNAPTLEKHVSQLDMLYKEILLMYK